MELTGFDLATLWDRIVGGQPEPPSLLVLATGLAALALVLLDPVWRVARHAVTIAHEGGHVIAALLVGRRLAGVRLHSDTSGVTVSRGRPTGPGMVLTAAAGYVTPSLLGAAGALLLSAGRTTILLWAFVVLLAAMLLLIRNVYGVLSVVVTGAIAVAVPFLAAPDVQSAFAYLAVWFLLLGGIRPVGELQRKRRQGTARTSDADQLARLTRVPAILWVAFFGLVTLLALAAGARWLLL